MLAGDACEKKTYLFLSEQTLLYNVGIRSIGAGRESVQTIISAGCSWYEVEESFEMLLYGDPVLEFSFCSMLGGKPIAAGMTLTDLPARPDGAARLLMEIHFSGSSRCEVKVTDLGFGEIYPASDLCWKESFVLEE